MSAVSAKELAHTRRCNRQDDGDHNEKPGANTLGLVEVKDEMQGKGDGDEPVDKAADHNACIVDLDGIQRGIKKIHTSEIVD